MESLSDIVAEMRGRGEDGRMDRRLWLDYADRIEAAWKRENAEWKAAACACVSDAVMSGRVAVEHEPVGNAAATREALENIAGYAETARCHTEDVHILSFLGEIEGWARAALSKPARNCDVMSRSMCTTQFSTTYEGNRDGLCDVQTEREKNIHLYYIEFNKWLFAMAAKREGEVDGR